ncbi:MAG: VCBS repeat-containing protein [Candidatus Hydrogenedentes bacterium]|nr:VCBS repeat-containing protein [Candidatus Hydrogenedentota bacterium]
MARMSWLFVCILVSFPALAQSPFPAFKEHVINPEAGTGLAITVADVNRDDKPDIIGVSSEDVAWYENPTWERHLIADTLRNSNVCIAPQDLDGDGIPELALGADWQFNNTASGGALYLLYHGDDVSQPWKVVTLLEEEPTLHRIRWTDVEGDGRPELIVAPLKGRDSQPPDFTDTGARLFLLRPPGDFTQTPWESEEISRELHVMHNIWSVPQEGKGDAILAASFEGVTQFTRGADGAWFSALLTPGNPEPVPRSGAGEIKRNVNGPPMLATIEPWHANQAVVYSLKEGAWERHVITDQLAGGHAVWWADFDRDGQDEVLIGWREKAGPREVPGLNVYDLSVDSTTGELTATEYVIDDGGMATEDALAADLNGDGWPDIVAYGRATQNVKYYENVGDNG